MRLIALSTVFIVSLFLQSCFENNEFFINYESTRNVPMNIVLPLIYEGTTPIKAEELQNQEKYSLLGNCKLNSGQDNTQSQKSNNDSSENNDKKEELTLSNELSGTPIPLFIMPSEGYEKIANNKVRQLVYIMPEVLGPGEHYCLSVKPMYKDTKNLSEVTQTFTFEFDTVGIKTNPETEYSGPQYSDPDFFELGFPMTFTDKDQNNDYLLPIHFQASQTFSPIFKFAKQALPDDAFWADPRKIRDSIHVCEILKTSELTKTNDNLRLNQNQTPVFNQTTDCQPVDGILITMIEDLPYSEDGKHILTNYAYFKLSGGALKLNTPYQIKVLYPFGDSKENISHSNQIHSFMLVDDELIISAIAPKIEKNEEDLSSPESEQETEGSENDQEQETSDEETASEETTVEKKPLLSPKDLFDRFKHAHGQVPGDSYIEIPIRSLTDKETNK